MTRAACTVLLALGTLPFAGCTKERSESAALETYQCPSCKETVRWQYHPIKPWITTGKEVIHICPDCERAWGANVSAANTCTMCGAAHLRCPACAKRSSSP